MKRLMDLLTRPLDNWDSLGSGSVYAEWVGVRQRIAVLKVRPRL
jgi:hypothetical protein